MKQILVAVDEHPHAEKIVDSAIELAGALSAKILLLYVVKDPSVPARFVDIHGDQVPEHYYLDQYHRTVDGQVKKILKAGLKYDGICGVGDPQDVILRTVKSREASMVIVGVHGHHGIGKLRAIGDVARNVIDKSPVPVLAIP